MQNLDYDEKVRSHIENSVESLLKVYENWTLNEIFLFTGALMGAWFMIWRHDRTKQQLEGKTVFVMLCSCLTLAMTIDSYIFYRSIEGKGMKQNEATMFYTYVCMAMGPLYALILTTNKRSPINSLVSEMNRRFEMLQHNDKIRDENTAKLSEALAGTQAALCAIQANMENMLDRMKNERMTEKKEENNDVYCDKLQKQRPSRRRF